MTELLKICLACLVLCLVLIETDQKAVIDERCPNGCQPSCRACHDCEGCREDPQLDALAELRVFVDRLAKEDQQLVQHALGKKEFIERLLRRSKPGPNAGDRQDSSVGKIGVRSMPSSESRNMRNFKKSLKAEDAKLLRNYGSKAGYIQALLDSKSGIDKRDQIATRTEERKRENSDADVQKFLGHLSEEDKKLFQKHPLTGNQIQAALAKNEETEESKTLRKIKKYLDDEYDILIKNHGSKAGYIQALLASASATPSGSTPGPTGSGSTPRPTQGPTGSASASIMTPTPTGSNTPIWTTRGSSGYRLEQPKDSSKEKKEHLLKNIHLMVEGLKRRLDEYSSLSKNSKRRR